MTGPLVVNADDLGVSRGATLGITRAHREGIVTSASLAVTTPHYAHALETCVRACPGLGVGLHFTLTSGRPAARAGDVPLLVDERGFFRWRFLPLLVATSRDGRRDLLAQIAVELDAQIRRLAEDGLAPDHIDSERHVHLIPGIFELVADAAKAHGIPFLRLGDDCCPRLVRPAHLSRLALRGGFAKSWLLSRLTRRARARLGGRAAHAGTFASYRYTGRADLFLEDLLKREPPAGVTEVMVHPGVPEESRGAAPDNPALERYLCSADRRRELEACVAARAWTRGWRLTTFGELAREGGPS